MNRFFGKVGYAERVQVRPGRWEDKIIEREFFGELVQKRYRNQSVPDQVHDDIRLNTDVEIIADAYLLENFSKIKYVCYGGGRWMVTGIEVDHPRIRLTLGGLYNGPAAES